MASPQRAWVPLWNSEEADEPQCPNHEGWKRREALSDREEPGSIMMSSNRATPATQDKIARLADLPRDELIASWIKAHGHPPPKGVKRGLLERDYAWRLQARVNGSLKRATVKTLLAIAREHDAQPVASTKPLKSGSRLVRDWHGVTHQVDVTNKSFVWNGQHFASLSAVARAITGTRWSGPRFFGL